MKTPPMNPNAEKSRAAKREYNMILSCDSRPALSAALLAQAERIETGVTFAVLADGTVSGKVEREGMMIVTWRGAYAASEKEMRE